MNSFTREELKCLVRQVDNPRWRLMVLVSFWHGLRASEVTSLRGRDIRDGYVACKRLKGSLETCQRYVDCRDTEPELDESQGLRELAAKLGPDEVVFPITRFGFYKVMKRAGLASGIPRAEERCHPHALKHSIAKQTIRSAGIQNVRQRLGHKSIASTGFYLVVDDEEAADAVEAAMGLR